MSTKRPSIDILSDEPIIKLQDDKFNRGEFVRAIGDIIHCQTTEVNLKGKTEIKSIDENLIIGLYGSWGHGKSSIINLLKQDLEGRQLKSIYFNPWMYGSENQLIAALFKVILQNTKLTDDPLKKLADLFRNYFSIIAIADQQTADIGKALIDTFDPEKNLVTAEEIKEEIDKILTGMANPLTIFIDDVDRLSKDEIHVLFKTLRLLASFKHVIYVVAFDFDMVSKSIKEKYVDGNEEDGKAFLEKIVQIPIRIPEIQTSDLKTFTINLINITNKIEIKDDDIVFNLLFDNYFKTPRDIIRLINGFRFTQHYFSKEIDLRELLLIEMIRIKVPNLFHIIKILYFTLSKKINSDLYRSHIYEFLNSISKNLFLEPGKINSSNPTIVIYSNILSNFLDADIYSIQSQKISTNVTLQPWSLKNPEKLKHYFEKSAEINQDEAETE